MRGTIRIMAVTLALAWPCAGQANASGDFARGDAGAAAATRELPPYLQCVPYARERSGVRIFGDARTWWDQAAGRYKRGTQPRPGAVMTFRPSGGMTLGHVAAVARVVDSRTVLLDHANWSPIGGRRGQIERGVRAVDVSPANDWSQVRVWYDPIGDLGTTAWPVAGFIYNERDDGVPVGDGVPLGGRQVIARAGPAAAPALQRALQPALRPAVSATPSKRFAAAFADLAAPAARPVPAAVLRLPPARPVKRAAAQVASADPIGAALARYER